MQDRETYLQKKREYSRQYRKSRKEYCLQKLKEWRDSHKEYISTYAKSYREKKKELRKQSWKNWYEINSEKVKQRQSTPEYRFRVAQNQSKKRSLSWTIPFNVYEILIVKPCDYCGSLLPTRGIGLDRLENSIGYVVDNVVPCCTSCNRIKGPYLTYDEMKAAMKAVLEVRKFKISKILEMGVQSNPIFGNAK